MSQADHEEDVKPKLDKINLRCVHERKELKFCIKTTAPIKKIMDKAAEQWGMERKSLRFTFGNTTLRYEGGDTPESLEMEEDDQIDVFVAQQGGGS